MLEIFQCNPAVLNIKYCLILFLCQMYSCFVYASKYIFFIDHYCKTPRLYFSHRPPLSNPLNKAKITVVPAGCYVGCEPKAYFAYYLQALLVPRK